MAWHIIEKLLEQVAEHSTIVGKFWVTFFFVLRFLLVVSIADTVFGDERDKFVCNTLTPGCENICFNDFSPISLISLWALQILGVSLPTVMFMVYTAHKMEKIAQAKKLRQEERDKRKKLKQQKIAMRRGMADHEDWSSSPPGYDGVEALLSNEKEEKKDEKKENKEEKKDDKEEEDKVVATKLDSDTPSKLMLAYTAQVVFRLAIEITFIVAQLNIYVYKFWVPELFKCARWPCPNVVDCFVDRPKEKTIMLWIMFGTAIIMVILNVMELYHLGIRKIATAWKTRSHDITKEYKAVNNGPSFGGHHRNAAGRYPRGYPQAVGIRVAYARSSISGEGGNDFDGDQFI